MRAVDRKQSDEHNSEIIARKIRALRKSQNKSEHVNNLSPTPKKRRRRRDSFLEVKAKIHDLLRSTVYHRGHRYDVRAADREAIQIEQRLMRSCCEGTSTDTAIRRLNLNRTKISSKQKQIKGRFPESIN
ncbi:unnamed protein product [Acanthocheilonema viteae]|uniref:Uncharacterized protein n=1 Tax=Acanthocheilonema viteae TaxID=6277 RepID=A0A498S181_ACAVI|nr:unnamed protein product [Acanthocheilonema viteae]